MYGHQGGEWRAEMEFREMRFWGLDMAVGNNERLYEDWFEWMRFAKVIHRPISANDFDFFVGFDSLANGEACCQFFGEGRKKASC